MRLRRPTQPLPFPFVSLFPSRRCRSPLSLLLRTAARCRSTSRRERERGTENQRGGPGGKERVSPSVDPATGFYSRMSIFRQLEPTRRVTKGSGFTAVAVRERKKKRSGALRLCVRFIRGCTERAEEGRARAHGDTKVPWDCARTEAFRSH